jgi:hypothetical protein
MEPLKPQDKHRILADNPAADPAEVEEYERLLSERFAVDPDAPVAAPNAAWSGIDVHDREARIAELYQKLFFSSSNRSN